MLRHETSQSRSPLSIFSRRLPFNRHDCLAIDSEEIVQHSTIWKSEKVISRISYLVSLSLPVDGWNASSCACAKHPSSWITSSYIHSLPARWRKKSDPQQEIALISLRSLSLLPIFSLYLTRQSEIPMLVARTKADVSPKLASILGRATIFTSLSPPRSTAIGARHRWARHRKGGRKREREEISAITSIIVSSFVWYFWKCI